MHRLDALCPEGEDQLSLPIDCLLGVHPVIVQATSHQVRSMHKKLLDDAAKARKLMSGEVKTKKVVELNRRYADLIKYAEMLVSEAGK